MVVTIRKTGHMSIYLSLDDKIANKRSVFPCASLAVHSNKVVQVCKSGAISETKEWGAKKKKWEFLPFRFNTETLCSFIKGYRSADILDALKSSVNSDQKLLYKTIILVRGMRTY